MPEEQDSLSRRGFLKAAVLTTAAAATVGTGAAVLTQEAQTTATISSGTGVVSAVPATIAPVLQNPNTTQEMAQLAAENMRLRTELDAANRRIISLEEAQSAPHSQLEATRLELGAANQQVSVLAGLVALYEQLENVDLGEQLEAGLESMGETLGELTDELPTLADGLALGQDILAQFEADVPLLDNGRLWLQNHLAQLGELYALIGEVLEEAVDRTEPLLDMLKRWFDEVLKWLPFGMGNTAVQVMAGISSLIEETPRTLQGVDINIGQPLDAWLAPETGETEAPVVRKVIHPLREKTLSPTAVAVQKIGQTKTTYQTELEEKVRPVLADRRAVRELIDVYRAKHEV